jgi:hypothetical protein
LEVSLLDVARFDPLRIPKSFGEAAERARIVEVTCTGTSDGDVSLFPYRSGVYISDKHPLGDVLTSFPVVSTDAKPKSKKPARAFTIREMMQFSKRKVRKRSGLKRGSAPISKPTSHSETGKLGPDDLKRWKKREKPIEIIG